MRLPGARDHAVTGTDADGRDPGLDGITPWWWSGAMDDTAADDLGPAAFRPLFEEPTAAFEREHPWSGPLAFVVGGMALPTMVELADQYVVAAGLLVDAVMRGDCEDYLVPNPVLFLHRHVLELRLKWLMGEPARTHDLDRLVRDLASPAPVGLGVELPEWLERRLAEFAAIDPGSTSFRYARTRDRSTRQDVPVDGEVFVDVRHLREVMDAVHSFLRRTPLLPPSLIPECLSGIMSLKTAVRDTRACTCRRTGKQRVSSDQTLSGLALMDKVSRKVNRLIPDRL